MKQLKLSKQEIIKELQSGKVIRITSGMWNSPTKNGKIANNVDDIERLYRWASLVDVYESCSNGVDYDLIGCSSCDMF